MNEEKKLSVTELPNNYYFNGSPDTVIDRVTDLSKLNGDFELAEKRALLVREVSVYCPVVFLDELISALEKPESSNIQSLINAASHNEVNLKTNNLLNDEQKAQISALAFNLLSEKINSANSEKLLPILHAVQEYVADQKVKEAETAEAIMEIENHMKQLRKDIEIEQASLKLAQQELFLDFIQKLNNLSL
jgi:hypothetical protein